MLRQDDSCEKSEMGAESAQADPKQAADVLPLLNEALGSVAMCRTGAAAELAAFASVLGRIVPHLPEGAGRATLERAHHAFSAVTIDASLTGGLLERAAATLTRLQKDRITVCLAPEFVRVLPGHSQPKPASLPPGEATPASSRAAQDARRDSDAQAHDVHSPRDAETVELFGDFLQEAEEGLERAENVLMEVEQSGADAERVNLLFRVFHTIKGVAGCLEITDVTSLGHITETLLDEAREGTLDLAGEPLQLVFEATAAMRRLLAGVKRAIEQNAPLTEDASIRPTLRRIEAALKKKPNHVAAARFTDDTRGSDGPATRRDLKTVPARGDGAAGAKDADVRAGDNARADDVARASKNTTPGDETRAAADYGRVSADPPTAQAVPGAKLRETLKVDLERVDSIVEMIGELIIVESMVVNAPEIAGLVSVKVRNYLGQLTKISRDLQNVSMRMRMVPVRGVFQKMARMVRELANKTGKAVVLTHSGEGAEMDRSMIERVEDPLIHMIRNAVDHAIEPAAERAAARKSGVGSIKLSAYHEGGSIVIEIADDGRGLSRDAIVKKAVERGLIRDGEKMSDGEVHNLIFLPGFSTASKVTEISGRGVGMDVVKRNVEAMRGRVIVLSEPGRGTRFKMVLPLTLAIIDGMLVVSGNERYIIPSLSIVESLQPTPSMVRTMADRGELIAVRGEILPLVRLDDLFGAPRRKKNTLGRVVVVESLGRKVALFVDDVITQQQVVIKPLGAGLGNSDYLSGAAILPDGRVGLILNVDQLGAVAAPSGHPRSNININEASV